MTTTYWDGGGADEEYDTVDNWSDGIPGPTDDAVFDNRTAKDCSIPDDYTPPSSLTIDGYVGTISTAVAGTFGDENMDFSIGSGTIGDPSESSSFYCKSYTQSGGTIKSLAQYVYSNVLVTGGNYDDNVGFDSDFRILGTATRNIDIRLTIPGIAFRQGTINLLHNLESTGDVTHGADAGGEDCIINMNGYDIVTHEDLNSTGGSDDIHLIPSDGSIVQVVDSDDQFLSVGPYLYTLGEAGGGLWHLDINGQCTLFSDFVFHSPGAAGTFDIDGMLKTSGTFYGWGADLEVGWLYIPEGKWYQGTSDLIITSKSSGTPPGDNYAIYCYSPAAMDIPAGSKVVINTQTDCGIYGATLRDLEIDSGGNNITVTATDCVIYDTPIVADGDTLVIVGGSRIQTTAAEYCSVEDVSRFMQLKLPEPLVPDADAAAGQTTITFEDTSPFAVGMTIKLTQSSQPAGEIHIIKTVTDNTSITTTANIIYKKEIARDFKVRIMNGFTELTRPTFTGVAATIEEVQDEMDAYCRTTWLAAGKAITLEYHDYRPGTDRFGRHRDYSDRGRNYTRFRPIVSWDKIEIWNGSTYEDLVAGHTVGRHHDYWVEDDKGVVHFANKYPYRIRKSIRLEYHYGHASIPKDIRKATTYLVASQLLMYEDNSMNLTEGGGESIGHQQRSDMLEKKAYVILLAHQEHYVHD